MVGNERTSQSRQAVVQREAAGRDEDGRNRPVTVTDSRGKERTLGADWHTQAQAGRTSESVLCEFVAGAIVQWHRQHTHAHTQAHTVSNALYALRAPTHARTHTRTHTHTLAVHPATE